MMWIVGFAGNTIVISAIMSICCCNVKFIINLMNVLWLICDQKVCLLTGRACSGDVQKKSMEKDKKREQEKKPVKNE